jgi:hypothetical protein
MLADKVIIPVRGGKVLRWPELLPRIFIINFAALTAFDFV